ncbi:hypothetical protein [Streptomyces sp. NPDC058401]|uniref:hypothetical protein n=1 Tax=Streptomyces sp. NPDC058401 TaxID=3346480 RepID=UPI003657FA36
MPETSSSKDRICSLTRWQVIGKLWLRDLELTAWRVLHADHTSADPSRREAFFDAWTSV